MGSKKKQETTTQNTFGYQTPPDTGDIRTLRDWKPQEDPSIPYTYGRMRSDQRNAFRNPYGAYTTPAIRDATLRTSDLELGREEAQARRQSQFDVNNQTFNKDLAIAGLTRPELTQTGGTATTTKSGGFWGDLLLGMTQGAGQGSGAAGAAA